MHGVIGRRQVDGDDYASQISGRYLLKRGGALNTGIIDQYIHRSPSGPQPPASQPISSGCAHICGKEPWPPAAPFWRISPAQTCMPRLPRVASPCTAIRAPARCHRLGHRQPDTLDRSGHQGGLARSDSVMSPSPPASFSTRSSAPFHSCSWAAPCSFEVTLLGRLNRAMLFQAMLASSAASSNAAPGATTTKATTSSPHSGCGRPTTLISLICGMFQQHLLDLARIDVGAARDDHVLGCGRAR